MDATGVSSSGVAELQELNAVLTAIQIGKSETIARIIKIAIPMRCPQGLPFSSQVRDLPLPELKTQLQKDCSAVQR
jgi:hypothetical protein